MALYTGSGDDGTTKTFGCTGRISKSSPVAEALGTLDEINSLLGIAKVRSYEAGFAFEGEKVGDLVGTMQQNLFTIQAELAGAAKKLERAKVAELEDVIERIEKALPPIRTFFVSGGTELAATFDFARTVARRAERRVVGAVAEGAAVGPDTLAYLNRLSSGLYALARLSNHISGIKEEPPRYS